MALLGDVETVKKMIAASGTTFNANHDDRLLAIQLAVSAALEYELGARTFGSVVSDTTEILYAGDSPVLLFTRPARAITSVTVGGTITGGTVADGSELASSYWAHDPIAWDTGLILGLRLLGGNWGYSDAAGRPLTPVTVVGDFIDSDDDAVIPDDVAYAANYLISEQFKKENAGPSGFTGPDGSVMPIRDAWKDPLITRVIAKYRVGARKVPTF